jgi:hypothetical protein
LFAASDRERMIEAEQKHLPLFKKTMAGEL